MNIKPMRCPACKTDLEVIGQARLETLEEYALDPNETPSMKDKYACLDKKCKTRELGIFWNYIGELYTESYESVDKKIFIDNNDAPFGSIQRATNVEVYKKDENFPFLNLWYWRINIVFKYKANEEGEILSRWWGFEILRREGRSWIYERMVH